MLQVLTGNLFDSPHQTLVNTVNCVGVMGKGVALEFKRLYPAMFADYQRRCRQGEVRLGEPYLYTDLFGTRIVNFPTKGHWRSTSQVESIAAGLDVLAARVGDWGITSLALPALGCGNGGLRWTVIGPLIHAKLGALNLDVAVYAPAGTPAHQLSSAFLTGAGDGRSAVGHAPGLANRTRHPR